MKTTREKWIALFCVTFCGFFVFLTSANALEIVVEPANAQREVGGKVRVHVYADSASNLISMGIKVSFDPLVLQVQVTDAAKYEDVENGWLMDADGDPETTGDQHSEPAVEIDNDNGIVTMIGGHLEGPDTGGLSGKVLLGWIVFEAINNGNSNINCDVAKPAPFDNFVNLDGSVDEPTNVPDDLGIICVMGNVCEGDFDGNGYVTGIDFNKFRRAMNSSFADGDPNYDPAVDFDASGYVTGIDFNVFRQDMNRDDCPCAGGGS